MERATWRRVHSATGLFPLGAFLVFHAWEHWPVHEGRDALFARLDNTSSAPLEIAFVLVPLLVHAALGVMLSRDEEPEPVYASPAFRRLQLVTGVLTGLFVLVHLVGVWLPRVREQNPTGAAFSALLDQAGDLPGVVLYALGLGAACTHFGQGLGAALQRLRPTRMSAQMARICGAAIGILLWLALLDELAAYASAAPLL